MKKTQFLTDIKLKSIKELDSALREYKVKLQESRFNIRKIKKVRQMRDLKKNIARIKTILAQKRREQK